MSGITPRLPAPTQVLVAAGRQALHAVTGPLPSAAESDAAALAQYARRHGMVAFLPHVIPLLRDLDATACEHLHGVVRQHAVSVLHDTSDLLSIVRHLTRAGIDFVVLKGAVFSLWAYGNPGVRPFVDVDVLITERARRDALRALERIGFAPPVPSGAAHAIYAGIGAWPLKRAGGLGVDLHWRPAAKRFSTPLTADAVLRQAIPVRLGDQFVRAPAPAHAAALALLHAAKHIWYALELTLAIAWLVRRDDIDWADVHDLLQRAGAIRPAAAGLRLAADMFGTPVPPPFTNDARAAAVDRLCRRAHSALCLPPGTFVDRWLDRRTHLAAFDRWRDRLQYDIRRVLEPTPLEWEWLPLPAPLAPFYVPLRVVRLAVRGTARISDRIAQVLGFQERV